jgi:hypothetical protein
MTGSSALALFGLARNPPKDVDYFTNQKDFVNGKGEDHTYIPMSVLKNLPMRPTLDGNTYITSPDAVYTIKCSHLGWDIHWQKTLNDTLWLKSKGCKIIPELFDALVLHWQKVNGNKEYLSLKQDKKEFFTDHVTYKYDHDYLHELVAHPQEPMYKHCLQQGEEVLIDKEKFLQMTHSEQVRMFREEITVIAVERWVVPSNTSWVKAYRLSLKKTIVSLTKGWATEFIVKNIGEFVKPDFSYFRHILNQLKVTTMNGQELISQMFTEYKRTEKEKYPIEDEHQFIAEIVSEASSGSPEWENVFQFIEGESGGEGEAEYCYAVFSYEGKAYKAEFSYYSYQGCDYDNFADSIREVTPKQKTVTVYE